MIIVALYKTWSGEEWLEASVRSIYNHVDKIVLLTSGVSWIGGKGNPSIPVIERMLGNDPSNKLVHINRDEPNQIKHCMIGYKHIQEVFPETDYVQLIDSDEVWDKTNLVRARRFLEGRPNVPAYRTHMFTYLKSPYYRVSPPEPLKPVCFINAKLPDMGLEPRGCAIKPFVIMDNVWCHHYVFVREHFNKVLEKLIQSHVSEKQPYENMSRWIPEVWNRLPDWNRQMFPNGIHPAIGFGHSWKSLQTIRLDEIPEILKTEQFRHILTYGSQ